MALTGETRRVIGPIGGDESSAVARYTVSGLGDLAFVPGEVSSGDTDLAWFGVGGITTTVRQGTSGIRTLRLSPDGARVAFTTEVPETDLLVFDFERHTTIRLPTSGGVYFPVWTPDGKRIAFEHEYAPGLARIEWTPADGSGAPEVLSRCPDGTKCFPTDFSRAAVLLALSAEATDSGTTDVFLFHTAGDGALLTSKTPVSPLSPARLLLESSANRTSARFSPDGSLIAYASTETGRSEIYIQTFPALDRKTIVSANGGERPTWSGDGKRIFYRHLDKIYSAQVSAPATLAVTTPVVLIDKLPGNRYDAAPDGTRFIMGRPRGEWGSQTQINVVIGAVRRPTQ
jgi:dipeptidyl aminopeptidase/acylaminoacyl peptidase